MTNVLLESGRHMLTQVAYYLLRFIMLMDSIRSINLTFVIPDAVLNMLDG